MKIESILSFSDLRGTELVTRFPRINQDFDTLFHLVDHLRQNCRNDEVLSAFIDNGRFVQVNRDCATIVYHMHFVS